MGISINSRDRKSLLIAILFIVLLYPYLFWGVLSNMIYVAGIGIVLSLLLFSRQKVLTNSEKQLLFFYEFVCFVYLLLNITVHGFGIGGILIRLPYLLFFFALFMENSSMKKVMNFIVNIVSVVSIIGLLLFLLFRVGLPLPNLGEIAHYNVTEFRTYSIYPFFLVPHTADLSEIVRFCGMFDEPGVSGTFSVFFLYYLKFNYKDWRSWIITIVGIFTFSLFFYGMLFINLVFRSLQANKGFFLSIIVISLIGISYNYTKDNQALNALIWERFEVEDGKIKGDNRINEDAEIAYEKMRGTSDYWLGLTPDKRERFWDDARGGSSYKNVVANNGMIFFALYVLFFLAYGRHYLKSKKDFILYALLVILSLYQRPNIFGLPYMFFYACVARGVIEDLPPSRKMQSVVHSLKA